MNRRGGFLLIEVLLAVGILLGVLGASFAVLQATWKLQDLSVAKINLAQNQTVAMQKISQQVSIFSRTAQIETGEITDRLLLSDVAGNRRVHFYRGVTEEQVGVLYMFTQSPAELPGVNQLTDPHNVDVESFKVLALNNNRLYIKIGIRDRISGRQSEYADLVEMLNGMVL